MRVVAAFKGAREPALQELDLRDGLTARHILAVARP
jgi:hypothetical protein